MCSLLMVVVLQKCSPNWQMWPVKCYMRWKVNSGFLGLWPSRLVPARRSSSQLSTFQPFPSSSICANLLSLARVLRVLRFFFVHFNWSTDDNATEYWLDLGQSVAFEGQTLIDCVRRIHDDILKVWNFHDPHEVCLLYPEHPVNVYVYFRLVFVGHCCAWQYESFLFFSWLMPPESIISRTKHKEPFPLRMSLMTIPVATSSGDPV